MRTRPPDLIAQVKALPTVVWWAPSLGGLREPCVLLSDVLAILEAASLATQLEKDEEKDLARMESQLLAEHGDLPRQAPGPPVGRYRKKPVVIEASQWFKNGDHPDDGNERFPPKAPPGNPFVSVPSDEDGSASDPRYTGEFAGELYEGKVVRYFRRPDISGGAPCRHCGLRMHVHGWIDTKEGGHIVCPGDWIVTGIQGEHYPVKPDIFAATYEPEAAPPRPASGPSALNSMEKLDMEHIIEIDEDGKVNGPDLEHELASALNRFSAENPSNTPDWILAQFLLGCLAAWNNGVQQRETWYGRSMHAGSIASNPTSALPVVRRDADEATENK